MSIYRTRAHYSQEAFRGKVRLTTMPMGLNAFIHDSVGVGNGRVLDRLGWRGFRCLTFDMSGVRRQAKPAGARPFDGVVRSHKPSPA